MPSVGTDRRHRLTDRNIVVKLEDFVIGALRVLRPGWPNWPGAGVLHGVEGDMECLMQDATARRETVLRLPVGGAQLKHHPLAIFPELVVLRHFQSHTHRVCKLARHHVMSHCVTGWGTCCKQQCYLAHGCYSMQYSNGAGKTLPGLPSQVFPKMQDKIWDAFGRQTFFACAWSSPGRSHFHWITCPCRIEWDTSPRRLLAVTHPLWEWTPDSFA